MTRRMVVEMSDDQYEIITSRIKSACDRDHTLPVNWEQIALRELFKDFINKLTKDGAVNNLLIQTDSIMDRLIELKTS
jgi:hypothetical protein